MIIMAFLWCPMTTGSCCLHFPTPHLTGCVWECLLKAEPFPQSSENSKAHSSVPGMLVPWDGPLQASIAAIQAHNQG